MDIITALVDHHGVLRQLYQKSENDPAVFEEFTRHLVVHHTMEEKYCSVPSGENIITFSGIIYWLPRFIRMIY